MAEMYFGMLREVSGTLSFHAKEDETKKSSRDDGGNSKQRTHPHQIRITYTGVNRRGATKKASSAPNQRCWAAMPVAAFRVKVNIIC